MEVTMKLLIAVIAVLLSLSFADAKVVSMTVEYKEGDAVLEGYLSYNDSFTGKRPGILIVHEWKGLGPYAKKRADQLAVLGYIAFAADIYGKGIRPNTNEEAAKISGQFKKDRKLLRARIQAGLETLKSNPMTDMDNLAAIGYCFGGTTVLELARSGVDLKGVASFHGGLDTPTPDDAKNIKAKVLVLHGGDDPFVPAEHITAFHHEMRKADVDWQMISYGGAVHSFTVPDAGNDPGKGAAYNEKADVRSWKALLQFFGEIFKH